MAERDLVIQGLIQLQLQGKGGAEAVEQMKGIVQQAREVEKQVGGFGKGTKEATQEVGKLDAAFSRLGATVASYFGARVVANFLRDSYVGFAKTERQALAVENQIKSLSGQAGASTEEFRGFIQSLSQASGILDDDLVPAFQRALGVFNDVNAAQEATRLAARFAAAGIGDVVSNTEKLTAVFQTGSTRALREFGIVTKATAGDTLDVAEAIDLVAERAKTLPLALNDAQSRINALGVAWDTLKDKVGEFLDLSAQFALGPQAAAEIAASQAVSAATQLDTKLDAIKKAAIERDKQLQAKANADKQAQSLKDEQDRLAKVADLNQKNAEAILQARIAIEKEGTKERLALELQLLDLQKAAALKAAKDIGANPDLVGQLFGNLQRQKVLDFKAAPPAKPQETPDVLKAVMDEWDERAKIAVEAQQFINEQLKDLTKEGTAARIQAEADIEIASLDERVTRFIENSNTTEAQRTKIAEIWAKRRRKIQTDATTAEIKMEKAATLARISGNLQAAAAIGTAIASLFEKNKAAQYAAAIINTASAVVAALAQPPGPPTTIPFAIAAGIMGAAQIATISRTHIGSGGSPSLPSAGSAPKPSPSTSVAPQTQQSINALSGRSGGATGQIVVNVKNAFGDKRSMRKLGREIEKVQRYDPKRIG